MPNREKSKNERGVRMNYLGDLLAVNQRRALGFFFVSLKDVCEPTVKSDELLYNASVLAHFAQVSCGSNHEIPTPSTLEFVFDNFILDTSLQHDAEMMEVAGTSCLFLTGFWENQMQNRHNIRWFSGMGRGFLHRAASCRYSHSQKRAQLLDRIACKFEFWRERYSRLSQEFRDQPFLLEP